MNDVPIVFHVGALSCGHLIATIVGFISLVVCLGLLHSSGIQEFGCHFDDFGGYVKCNGGESPRRSSCSNGCDASGGLQQMNSRVSSSRAGWAIRCSGSGYGIALYRKHGRLSPVHVSSGLCTLADISAENDTSVATAATAKPYKRIHALGLEQVCSSVSLSSVCEPASEPTALLRDFHWSPKATVS
nr:hypothetical protein CFP56_04551 [Quercus suber]